MRITVVAVGRLRRGPIEALCAEYTGRLSWPVDLREVEARKRLDGAALKAHEAALLADRIPSGARLVALDEHGRAIGSAALAGKIGAWRDDGQQDICFLVGGADGLDPALRDRADLVLAFGPQTWPHQLVRVMLLEQIYRAERILAGHPYHRA